MIITYTATRNIIEEPVRFVPEGEVCKCVNCAKTASGKCFPASIDADGSLVVILTLQKDEAVELELCKADDINKVELVDSRDDSEVKVNIAGKLFTKYVYDAKFIKPYLGPVLASDGETSFTRLDFETEEHPHQRSIIGAIGDINGIDFFKFVK